MNSAPAYSSSSCSHPKVTGETGHLTWTSLAFLCTAILRKKWSFEREQCCEVEAMNIPLSAFGVSLKFLPTQPLPYIGLGWHEHHNRGYQGKD